MAVAMNGTSWANTVERSTADHLYNSSLGLWLSLGGGGEYVPLPKRERKASCLRGMGVPCPRVELTSG